MPYRRYRRRRRRTRRRRRKPRLRRTRRRMNRMSSMTLRRSVPDTLRVKLKWQEVRNTPNSTTDKQIYQLNGPFMPVASSATPLTQPMAWDQWILFYNNYQCYASSIKIIVANRANTVLVGTSLFPSNGNAANITTLNEAHTQPYQKTVYTSGSNGKPLAYLKSYMPVKKLEAHATSDEQFWAAVTANPNALKSWVVFSASTNLIDEIDLFYDVEITYYIKFFNRRPLDAS